MGNANTNQKKLRRTNFLKESSIFIPPTKENKVEDQKQIDDYELDSSILRRTSKAQLFKFSRSLTQGRIKPKQFQDTHEDSSKSKPSTEKHLKEISKNTQKFSFDLDPEETKGQMEKISVKSQFFPPSRDFSVNNNNSDQLSKGVSGVDEEEGEIKHSSDEEEEPKESISLEFRLEDAMDELKSIDIETPGIDSSTNFRPQTQMEHMRLLTYKIRNCGMRKKFIFYSVLPSSSMDSPSEMPDDDKSFYSEVVDYSEKKNQKSNINSNPIRRILKMNEKSYLYHSGMNFVSRKGNMESLPNQDSFFIYANSVMRIAAVFDGHGSSGHHISHIVCKLMMKYLLESPMSFIKPYRVFKEVFARVEASLISYLHDYNSKVPDWEKINFNFSGVSCTVAVITENLLHIAHIGDTRGLIGRRIKVSKKPPAQITNDHIPSNMTERIRIYSKGGEVKKLNSDFAEKVFVRGRVYPGLHITRSIGDRIASLIGVISDPEVITYEISSVNDHFLLLGTRSAFLYLDDFEINSLLQHFGEDEIEQAMEILYKRVKSSWIQNEAIFDDITMIINYF